MTSECSSCKCSFDISKSRRTRRALSYLAKPENQLAAETASEGSDEAQKTEGETNGHVKLKQFINVDVEKDESSRALLSQHFAEEKQLQLAVIKQPADGPEVVKFRGIVKRYVRALGHLVKTKRSRNRLEKPVLRLTV
ncbi:hypothetical protein RND81_03G155700 [Saponaria officinalis]|uniref:Uncharacterized protein n=1 Tax=Saponaria officinalis TaxID=3572 RepID=A0AAW1M996_SAPOF